MRMEGLGYRKHSGQSVGKEQQQQSKLYLIFTMLLLFHMRLNCKYFIKLRASKRKRERKIKEKRDIISRALLGFGA